MVSWLKRGWGRNHLVCRVVQQPTTGLLRVLAVQPCVVLVTGDDDQVALFVIWLVHAQHQWVVIRIDSDLGEAVAGGAICFLPPTPHPRDGKGFPGSQPDACPHSLPRLVARFIERLHWNQAQLGVLPSTLVGRQLANGFRSGVHGGEPSARWHVPLWDKPIARHEGKGAVPRINDGGGQIVLPRLSFPLVVWCGHTEQVFELLPRGCGVVHAHAGSISSH